MPFKPDTAPTTGGRFVADKPTDSPERAALQAKLDADVAAADAASARLAAEESRVEPFRFLARPVVAATRGAVALPALLEKGVTLPVSKITGTDVRGPLERLDEDVLRPGALRAQSTGEELADRVFEGLGAVGTGIGLGGAAARGGTAFGRTVAPAANPTVQKVGGFFAAQPALQAAGATTSGIAAQVAKDSGAGTAGQAGAAVAGGLAPFGAAGAVSVLRQSPELVRAAVSAALPWGAQRLLNFGMAASRALGREANPPPGPLPPPAAPPAPTAPLGPPSSARPAPSPGNLSLSPDLGAQFNRSAPPSLGGGSGATASSPELSLVPDELGAAFDAPPAATDDLMAELEALAGRQPAAPSARPRTQINASGESAASLEAQARLAAEEAAGQYRYLVNDVDGSVTPLIGVDSVDAVARPGTYIVQRGVGDQPYTVLDRGGMNEQALRGSLARAQAQLDELSNARLAEQAAPEGYPVVDDGIEVQEGTLDELLNSPQLGDQFLPPGFVPTAADRLPLLPTPYLDELRGLNAAPAAGSQEDILAQLKALGYDLAPQRSPKPPRK